MGRAGTASDSAAGGAAALLAAARRIVVKVGSSLLIDEASQGARRAWLDTLAADLAALRGEGRALVVVSSGAVALGRPRLGLRHTARLDQKQAAAAAGQSLLMQAWDAALAPHGIAAAQLLLTIEDTERRRRWLNARATLDTLLARGALPIINENDSVATDEIRYGDNDRLSARVAQLARGDLLVLLSDVDGLYRADPARDPGAGHVPFVARVTPAVEALAGPPASGGVGTGGMRTKLAAAAIAARAGCATLIASGRDDHPLHRLAAGGRATIVAAEDTPARAYKQWIAGALDLAGTLVVDDGAAAALAAGRSLLPAGLVSVSGEFERGSCLSIVDRAGRELARGIAAYNAAEARAIAGASTAAIGALLGYCGPDELVHRDDLVMMAR